MRSSIAAVLVATLLAACGGGGNTTATPSGCSGPSCVVALSADSAPITCALMSSGEVRCWGGNAQGQVGNIGVPNGPLTSASLVPVPVTSLAGASALGAGMAGGCAVVEGGALKCWGNNLYGQLGSATPSYRAWADVVPGLTGASAVSIGYNHTCALATGRVKCWGRNARGQLGNGTTTPSIDPVTVPTLAGVTAIAAGSEHSCAVVSGGAVWCWGSNIQAQLGNSTIHSGVAGDGSLEPVPVTTVTGATRVVAGAGFTCALVQDGTVKCWGEGTYGQLGVAVPGWISADPVTVPNVTGATAIAAGSSHACVIVDGGRVKCWGDNSSYQFGNGTSSGATRVGLGFGPEEAPSISGATAITCGDRHTCAAMGKAGVKCWGANELGQVGDGTQSNARSPTDVVF